MHSFRRLITAICLTVLSIVLLFSAAFAYLIVTPLGGKILLRYFKQQFSSVGLMHIGHYEGSLHNGFLLRDVRIVGLAYLPNAVLRIQEIHARLPLWDLRHSDLGIFNARLLMPGCDPVVFTGDVYAGQVKGELYANSIDIHEATRFWTSEDIRKSLRGYVSNLDFTIQGPLSSPQVTGSFAADSIRYKGITLNSLLSKVNIMLLSPMRHLQMKGEVSVESGLVNVRHVDFKLLQSEFIFQGDVFNPKLDIHLGSKVEDMDFHLTISGLSSNPQLTISSDPPMAPQEALNVLFTHNAWSASTSPFNGATSTQLAENFLDYSLQDYDQQEFGFKTKLTDNLKLGAEMDEMPSTPGETNVYYARKINGEMDMNEHMSLNVSHQVMSQDSYPSYEYQGGTEPEDTQIYMQYKKRF